MGISGLLPFLKEALVNVNVRQFEGQTVAVDTYCWIYRGAFGCAEDLAMGRPADGHVKYVLRYVNRLLEWGIKPVMIFDGSCLPSKKGTELKRRESKDTYRKKAAQLMKEGRINEARECFQRCIECTPKMALEVIQALHSIGVDVLVAPYEADAQLAFLNKANIAQLIITEDSDLILFGCEKILYKLDLNGNAQLIEKQKIISITQFDSADNFERFRWMCILSGCDYLENLPGIGLGKARKFLKSNQNKTEIDKLLKQIPKALKMPNLVVSNEYIESFMKADKTFRYQIVFDPLKRKLVSLHPYSPEIAESKEDLSYAGIFYDNDTALQHSLGNLDVNSHEVVDNFNPDKWKYKPPLKYSNNAPSHMRSIWSESYTTMKQSTPFSNMPSSSTSNKTLPLSFPMSKDRVKTISSKPLNEQLSSKRKFADSLGLDSQGSSNSLCSVSEDLQQLDDKENDLEVTMTMKKKRLMTTTSQQDVNDLLTQYSSSSSSTAQIKSSYFSSTEVTTPSSPLVIRKNQSISQKKVLEDEKFVLSVRKSPEKEISIENDVENSDCMSPIVVNGSASRENKPSNSLAMFARNVSSTRRFLFGEEDKPEIEIEKKETKTLLILDDLDDENEPRDNNPKKNDFSPFTNPIKKKSTNIEPNKSAAKVNSKLAGVQNPKITSFLAKYQHNATNQFKLNK